MSPVSADALIVMTLFYTVPDAGPPAVPWYGVCFLRALRIPSQAHAVSDWPAANTRSQEAIRAAAPH